MEKTPWPIVGLVGTQTQESGQEGYQHKKQMEYHFKGDAAILPHEIH